MDSEFIDEEDLLKFDIKRFTRARFSLYSRYLNVLLLKTADPFIADRYMKYLKFKKRNSKEANEQNFF